MAKLRKGLKMRHYPKTQIFLLCLYILTGRNSEAAETAAEETHTYPIEDEAKLNEYRELVCKHVPSPTGDTQNLTWRDTLTKDDIFELAFTTFAFELTSEANAHLPYDIGWKKKLTDIIGYIAKITCNTEAISPAFTSGVKNLFQYYLYKINKTNSHARQRESDEAAWEMILTSLEKCAEDVKPIELVDTCGVVEMFRDKNGELRKVGVVEELFDREFQEGSQKGLDIIVDSAWWMFATTYARCYAKMEPHEDYIIYLFDKFRDDILGDLHQRWRGAGDLTNDFNLVFGPIDAFEEHDNLRFCSYAAFAYEDILEKHLIRPVMSFDDNGPAPNYKLFHSTSGEGD